jgi:polyisoprenoid-binding protein YceI
MPFTVDKSHSRIGFVVRHMVVSKVRGAFGSWEATAELDTSDLTKSKVSATIDVSSIDTKEEKRDAHLRSADFFDAEKYPKITFVSKRIEAKGKNEFAVVGDLTIRGTTREVTLVAEALGAGKDPWGNQRMGFELRGAIDRKDFGLTWNQVLEAGGVLVGEKVEIEIDLQVVAQ